MRELAASKAGERTDSAQVNAEVRPEKAEPPESGHGISSDERGEVPELLAVIQPDIGVAEQAPPYAAGVYGKGLKRHLRGELRRRGSRRLLAAGTSWTARCAWESGSPGPGPAGETWTAGAAGEKAASARKAWGAAPRKPGNREKCHMHIRSFTVG